MRIDVAFLPVDPDVFEIAGLNLRVKSWDFVRKRNHQVVTYNPPEPPSRQYVYDWDENDEPLVCELTKQEYENRVAAWKRASAEWRRTCGHCVIQGAPDVYELRAELVGGGWLCFLGEKRDGSSVDFFLTAYDLPDEPDSRGRAAILFARMGKGI